jgi:hypothetical protein
LEAENHTLEENADAYEIERLTLLQNIADMQQQVEEAEVQVATGYSVLTAAAPSTGTPRGAAGFFWSGSDEPRRTTVADSPSFAYVQWCFGGQLGCRRRE